jgi:1,4-alpha-glucan branching enzyme
MKSIARIVSILTLLPLLAGCAGGWRGGVAPAEWATGTPAAVASAPGRAAVPAAATASHAVADGAVFVWKGEGGTVAAAGEFNAWNTTADPLKKQDDGSWLLEKKLPAGRYAYKFVIDGTTWKADPGAAESVDDGYGGKNSLMVVGGAGTAPVAPAAMAAVAPAAGGKGTAGLADAAVFRYSGPGGTVAVAGEFNTWNTSADPMKKQADGTWLLEKKLAAGRYAYKFVIDGSTWKEDPAAKETVDDGYGGKNSVVVVGGAGAAPAAAVAPAAAPAAPAAGAATAAGANAVVFRFSGAGGTVAVAGEFNTWNTTADPMKKQADGTWLLEKKLADGRYAYKFVIDGTNWKEDPGAKESVDDGYGGKNSVIVVGSGTAAATAAPAATAPAGAAKPLAPGAKPAPPRVTAEGVVFTYAGAAKSTVSLCGDFNSWATTTDPMTQQADGTWTLTRKLAPGAYGYKFLVDGANWKPDDGNPESRDDGFGGKNSLVTVK